MARSIVGVNDPKAVKKWAGALTLDASKDSYFGSKFMAKGENAKVPVQILTDLESDAGEAITYDLLAELRMSPVEGDDVLEGKEESQRFYTDKIYIDQARSGVNAGGRMTRKRTIHNLRDRARAQEASWWARFQDELLFVYISGARGINDNFLLPIGYEGRASNPMTAPDSNHVLYGNDATAFNNIDATDKFSLRLIDRAKTKADTQGGGATNVPVLQPCKVDGLETFVCVMHTWQEDDLRADVGVGGWLDITKALATSEGAASPLRRGALGIYRGIYLHAHKNVIRFNNAGAGSNVAAARALFMGSQAAVVAYGSPGTNQRFDWHEETRDNGNVLAITTSSIFGVKKTTFATDTGPQDFGVFALDTAAAFR